MIPNSKQLKLSFLSTVASSRFSNTNFPEEPPEEPSVSFSSRARRDGFVSANVAKNAGTEILTTVAHSAVSSSTGGKGVITVALAFLATGLVSTGAIVMRSFSKKAPSPEVVATVAKDVETTVEKMADNIVPEIVDTATSQSSHSQPQSSSLKTRIGNLFTNAGEWFEDRMPFIKPNHQVATAGGAPASVAKKVVVSPVPSVASAVTYPYPVIVATSPYSRFTDNITFALQCKKRTDGYPAFAVYRDSLKPDAQALKSAIATKTNEFMLDTDPALASRHLYRFHEFLSELIFEVSKGNISNNYNLRTLKNSDLCTVPVMRQILSDTQAMLELPTLIKGAEDQRAHLKAKIKLYMATLDAYYNNGMVTTDWAALTKPTGWEMKNGSECLDAARFEDINSILLAGQQGKDINKHLASMLKKLMEDLGSVTGREQNIYSNKYKSHYDETTKQTIFTDYIMTKDQTIIAPWFSSH